jgi:photosystem II stability/assembly factor-like uncharacterized protein
MLPASAQRSLAPTLNSVKLFIPAAPPQSVWSQGRDKPTEASEPGRQRASDEWINAPFGGEAGAEAREWSLKRADEPDQAIRYYLQKRLPEGETELPVERYFEAMEEMRQMPLHSTADNRLFSREELRKLGPDQSRLGAWTSLGPGNIGGRVRAILINPQDPNVIYAAGVAGGVWKSTDAGQSWTPLADLIANLAVCSMAFDPKNPNVIYAGTGEGFSNGDAVRGAGIFRTTDAGQTWVRLASTANNTNFFFVNDLVVSANDSNRIYAATSTGVWRSTDGGETWSRVVTVTTGGGCHDLAARTDQPTDFLLAACGNVVQATVYRKTDAEGAGTWEVVLSDPGMGRTAVAFAPSNQNVVYAVAAAFTGTYQHGLHAFFRSDDGGAGGSWAARVRNTDANKVNTAILSNLTNATAIECRFGATNSFTGQSWYDLALAVDPLDANRVWVGAIDVFRSDDGGLNWGAAAFAYDRTRSGSLVYGRPDQLHPDQHFFVFHPQYDGATNQRLFIGNDGGVAPSLFAANANGTGVAAAVVFWRTAGGQDSFEPVARFDPATSRFVAAPIDLGPEGDQVILIPFGTGFRGLSGLANVRATIGGVNAPVSFAGAVPGLVGTDQANLRIDRSLAGRGEVDVVLTVDGKPANPVRVAFR